MVETICAPSRLRESFSVNDQNPPSFTMFPQLPMELRLAIWRFTLPRPRRVRPDERPSIPIALSITRESRELALMHYEQCAFPKQWVKDWGIEIALRPRYIDFSADLIYGKDISYFPSHNIQNMIQEYADSTFLETQVTGLLQEWLAALPRLREVVVMVHYRKEQAYGPLKPTELQIEKKLESIKTKFIQRIGNADASMDVEGHKVRGWLPNIMMEVCKPCFRHRGSRTYTNSWCRSRMGES